MKNTFQFNFNRLVLMLKHDIGKYWKMAMMLIGGSFAIATFMALLFVMTGDYHFVANEGHTVFFPMILIWGGALFVSFSFWDLNNDAERISYLGIPATHLEKYLSRFILTALVFPLLISILYIIYAFVYDSLALMALDSEMARFSFFSNIFIGVPTPLDYLLMFFAVHSVFFLGAISFRKIAFVKTFLAGFAIVAVLGLGLMLAMWLILPELFEGGGFLQDPSVVPNDCFIRFAEDYGIHLLYGLGFVITPIVFWVTGYFKLTEKEA